MTSVPKGITGVIHPPPQLKDAVDRTAFYVAKNGKQFEEKIIRENQKDEKFQFLQDTSPYHTYYLSKLEEYKVLIAEQNITAVPQAEDKAAADQDGDAKMEEEEPAKPVVRSDPYPYEFTIHTKNMSAMDLDVLKVTALYVAKHGKAFLTQIAQKERSNASFDFLKGSSPRFPIFQQFLSAYTKILNPPKAVVEGLEEDLENRLGMLGVAQEVVEWRKYLEEQQKLKADEEETERNLYASIDWHSFVIVETINFPEDAPQPAAPPAPTTAAPTTSAPPPPPARPPPPPGMVPGALATPPPPPAPAPTVQKSSAVVTIDDLDDEDMQIRTGYVRDTMSGKKRKATVLDPSGQEISIDSAEEHMRRRNIHPQWQEQKVKRQQDLSHTALGPASDIAGHLSKMFKNKPKDGEDAAPEGEV